MDVTRYREHPRTGSHAAVYLATQQGRLLSIGVCLGPKGCFDCTDSVSDDHVKYVKAS